MPQRGGGVRPPGLGVQTDVGSSNGGTAPLTPEESIAGVLERAFELSPGRSGQYVDWTGATMPF